MSAFDRFKSKFRAGQYIFKDGDIGTEMYIIQAGKVELLKVVFGNEDVISTLEKGDFFGEMAVLENLPRNLSARAAEDCEVIAINGTTFDKMIKSNIEIAVRMLRKFSTRLREADAENLRLRVENHQLTSGSAAPTLAAAAAAAPAPAAPVAAAATGPQPVPALEKSAPTAKVTPKPAPAAAAPPPPPPPAAAARPPAVLVVKGGTKTFPGASDEITIGRADPVTGLRPDIDLSAEDINRFISRRHAKILFRDGSYYMVEEVGVTNGTYLNGKRLQAGVYAQVQFGDELCFGKVFMMMEKPA
jgi:hypothetical protein